EERHLHVAPIPGTQAPGRRRVPGEPVRGGLQGSLRSADDRLPAADRRALSRALRVVGLAVHQLRLQRERALRVFTGGLTGRVLDGPLLRLDRSSELSRGTRLA